MLIALGGGVLSALTLGVFSAIGVDAEGFVTRWVIPCGAAGAVLVAAWLSAGRRNVAATVAPMLATVFTPLFALMLTSLLIGVALRGQLMSPERDALILFDVLLIVVVALVLYGTATRGPTAAPALGDRLQLVLVLSAIAVDVFVLVSMLSRLGAFGLSANRVAGLGLNLLLLVNLVGTAALLLDFVRSGRGCDRVTAWQMRYLPVYAAWAAIVVVAFPPVFGFR